jgi:hypothetical protein
MNENPASRGDTIEMNDSLDAVGVFRGWKNVFFVVVLICLVLTQVAFWMINLKIVPVPGVPGPAVQNAAALPTPADKPAADTTTTGGPLGAILGKLDFEHVTRAVELINGIVLVAALLFAASIFFGLMVSLVGRLGGLNHVSRAFIFALIATVLLVPWQVLGLNVLGVTWSPDELAQWLPAKSTSLGSMIVFYLRFVGYWAVVTLLLLLSQARSTRWSKSILHRLEII